MIQRIIHWQQERQKQKQKQKHDVSNISAVVKKTTGIEQGNTENETIQVHIHIEIIAGMSRPVCTDILTIEMKLRFDDREGLLNRIVVGRIRREKNQFHTSVIVYQSCTIRIDIVTHLLTLHRLHDRRVFVNLAVI